MRILLHSSSSYIFGAVVLIGIALYFLFGALSGEKITYVTTTVERGDIREIVAVSGVVEAENTAELAFAVTGVVSDVFIKEGDAVAKGDVLATLSSAQLEADRKRAVSSLQRARADKEELINGPQVEARDVTAVTVQNAEENVLQVTREEDEKVENAHSTLLSSNLIARSVNSIETATAPVVSGTYTCDSEGTYTIKVINFGENSFSYRVTGLEWDTQPAFFESPGAFGTCGLFIQFDPDENYNRSEWLIEIPNTQSASYQTNKNAYDLAVQQRSSAIESAENALELAEKEATLENAAPRSEAIVRANAAILDAEAQIELIDAQIHDRSIIAPFDGIITTVDILPGETADNKPVITVLARDTFNLTARIPEIDITKVTTDQNADVRFDAQSDEVIPARVDFISPLATEIDGVAYFEATIAFDIVPDWMRAGLNADIDIEVAKVNDVIRVPRRYIDTSSDTPMVFLYVDEEITKKEVELGFSGNDGYVEVNGIQEGVTIAAP